jgi:hypothetical protein
MKIRFGFVSNSSSTSFVVCIPRSYNPIDKEIENVYSPHGGEITVKNTRKYLKKLMKNGWVGEEGLFISDLLEDFILVQINTGHDGGSITNLTNWEKEDIIKIRNKIDVILEEK